ncbi:MAG: HAMP domain-containing sensor histidine kinase [Treponematales bacterium]
MRFKTKLAVMYGLLMCLTIPVFVYAVSCHAAWVCLYAGLMAVLTVLLSVFVIREMNSRQRQLTADVAHELRTPLACLRGSVEALIDGVWEPTPERLEGCNEEIQRLTQLVSDISLLTDIEWETITLNKTSFDAAKLLETTAVYFQGAAAQKGIAVILDTEPRIIRADYNRIKQVLINVLSNAFKYTDKGSVTITNRGREISIADTGTGIESDALPRVFDRFYRTDKSRARGTGGSGVGLTIAKALMKAHGGDIKVESEPGKGSVFKIIF